MLRKLCAVHLFSTKALDDLRPVREEEVAIFARNLNEQALMGGTVNLGKGLNVCATNALARAMIGRRVFCNAEDQGKADEFKEMVAELMRLAGVFNIGDFVPWLKWMDLQGVVGKMKRLHRKFDAFFNEVIEEHEVKDGGDQKGKGSSRDLLSVLIGLKKDGADEEDGCSFTNTDIKALLLNLFTAGTDTSSSTVEWALAELIHHPDILKKAQEELDSVVGRNRLVLESDLPKLPLLHAIVKENFRLHPATPLSIPRLASEECIVDGHRIPKNATLMVNVWGIARDPGVWSDPLEFRPARFLPGGENEHVDVKGNNFELIPFGAGRRICAGMSLGVKMIQFLTATLVHAFDWTLPQGLDAQKLDMEEAFGLTLQRAVPLVVHPVPRLAPQAYQ
ncbi:flavonoid 3'-monooxygenase-like [Iris pallida]|uniref:Flavonoid 3'-monooxygenase-like n=1 Tax=Iris pallida TaxID=29817 RepID=A0AAX6GR36_IRIPA|nr:flavonoid 3'-monooxygenase-like [Iris pallida]